MTILILGNINHAYNDLGSTYDLSQIPWVPDVVSDPYSIYALSVSSDVESVHALSLSEDIGSTYSLRTAPSYDTESIYALSVSSDVESVHALSLSEDIGLLYSIGPLYKDCSVRYSMRGSVYNDLYSKYGINLYIAYSDIEVPYGGGVESDIESSYSMRGLVYLDYASQYSMILDVVSDLEASHDITNINSIYKDLLIVYTMYTPVSETIVKDVLITVGI